MTKRNNHSQNEDETAEAIIAENAAHEGTPRTLSAERAQESWEEFKQKSNIAAEAVLEEVTHPKDLRIKARQTVRRAKNFYKAYQPFILGAAGLIVAGALYAALKPAPKKKTWRDLLNI